MEIRVSSDFKDKETRVSSVLKDGKLGFDVITICTKSVEWLLKELRKLRIAVGTGFMDCAEV